MATTQAGPAWVVAKLYEMNRPRELSRRMWQDMQARGMRTPLDRPGFDIANFTAPDELVTTAIDVADYREHKRQALRAHRTQIPADSPFLTIPDDLGREWYGVEYYTLLESRVELPARAGHEHDLFAGLR